MPDLTKTKQKPDVVSESKAPIATVLDKVGMEGVELPILVHDGSSKLNSIPAKVSLFISLDDPHSKGIHMSRLYIKAKEFLTLYPISFPTLASLSEALIETHQDSSFSSHIKVNFDYMLERKALISSETGFRSYPVSLAITRNKNSALNYEMELNLVYSSTCPCSAALAREIVNESFIQKFGGHTVISQQEISEWLLSEQSQIAVPHAQRSEVNIKLQFNKVSTKLDLDYWINTLEQCLSTPVQAVVKREDEQEFTRLNGTNMMFSEDAARRLKFTLDQEQSINDYYIKVNHLESLHAHNAVVVASKGIRGGYQT